MTREWPLVIFTVVSQLAVGAFLVTGIPLYWVDMIQTGGKSGSGVRLGVVLGALGLAIVGIFFSFFHIHRPLKAFRSVANVRTSWLSREILFELIFLFLLAGLAFLEWLGVSPLLGLALAAGFAGVLFLLSMSKIYVLKAIPVWNGAFTVLSFFLTALVLGALVSSFIFSLPIELNAWGRTMAAVSFVLLAADFANAVLFSPQYGIWGTREKASLKPPGVYHPVLHLLRLALFLPGIIFFGGVVLGGGSWLESGGLVFAVLPVCFLSAFAGEIIGRILFYGLNTRP